MNKLISLLALFALFSIIVFSCVITLGEISQSKLGNCNKDINGTVQNCTLSQTDYNTQTTNATNSAYIFNILQIGEMILVIAIFISTLYLLIQLGKKHNG